MVDCWELEDSSGIWELEDGTGCWLLEDSGVVAGGVQISGTHAKPLLILPSRPRRIPVDFQFILKAGLVQDIITRPAWLKGGLIVESLNIVGSLLSNTLRETTTFVKVRAGTGIPIKEIVKLRSSLLIPIKETVGNLISNIKNPKIKKVLLKKLLEYLDDNEPSGSVP